MAIVALVLSVFVCAFGALGIVSPPALLCIVRQFRSRAGLYAAAAFRVFLGLSLFLAAPTARAPEVVRILGVIIVVAGCILPLLGLERFRRILDWWSAQGPVSRRAWAGFALAFGLFLACAVAP